MTQRDNIGPLHLKHIFEEGKWIVAPVAEKFSVTAMYGPKVSAPHIHIL